MHHIRVISVIRALVYFLVSLCQYFGSSESALISVRKKNGHVFKKPIKQNHPQLVHV